jgi:hypothetical protein
MVKGNAYILRIRRVGGGKLGAIKKHLRWVWFDHRTDLPQWLTSRIGQIAVEWSVLERELEQLIQMLTDADIGIARIVSSRMNARTRLLIIGYLLEWYVYHGRLKSSYLKRFDKLANRIATKTQNKRDMVAHGLWSLIDRKWWVLRLAGQRQTPELRPEIEKLSRAFLPQRELVTRDKLDEIKEEIISDARSLESFCSDVFGEVQHEGWKYEPPKYSRRRRH